MEKDTTKQREFKKGVYRTSEILGAEIDIVVFDGVDWWVSGWEVPLRIGNYNGDATIAEDCIKDLLWEWTEAKL